MNRSIDCWSKCDPSAMSKMSTSAIFFALKDAKEDILTLSMALEIAERRIIDLEKDRSK